MEQGTLATIGGGLAAASTIAMAVWNGYLRNRVKMATSTAEAATEKQKEAQAVAGETVYTLVTEQLKRVQDELERVRSEVDKLRDQLRAKEDEVHQLRMHIVDLENCLREHGITPPAMRSYIT